MEIWNSGLSRWSFCARSLTIAIRTDLSAGVDVYSEWIDACDAVAKDTADPNREDDATHASYDPAGLDRTQPNRNSAAAVEGDEDADGDFY